MQTKPDSGEKSPSLALHSPATSLGLSLSAVRWELWFWMSVSPSLCLFIPYPGIPCKVFEPPHWKDSFSPWLTCLLPVFKIHKRRPVPVCMPHILNSQGRDWNAGGTENGFRKSCQMLGKWRVQDSFLGGPSTKPGLSCLSFLSSGRMAERVRNAGFGAREG